MTSDDEHMIPVDVGDLSAFRRWTLSGKFPRTGRIDYLQGTIEVDMSPEELQSHGNLKVRLLAYIERIVSEADLGQVYVDSTRLGSRQAGLSCEPDVLFVSWEALRSGRARYLPSTPDHPERMMEVEGAADLVVEVVSKHSVGKDTKRLPPLYARAGVRELWIADARGSEPKLDIFHLVEGHYEPALADPDGFQASKVLGRALRLRREPGPLPHTWRFQIEESISSRP